jgi:hypothetical protein
VLYPNAEFLFELIGMGGPMLPYQYYSSKEDDIDKIAAFYFERLPQFTVELDEVAEGYRHLMLTRDKFVLEELGHDVNEISQRGRELDGTLSSVEIIHSNDDISISRMRITRHAYDRAEDIPPGSIIIILEYFKNPYG